MTKTMQDRVEAFFSPCVSLCWKGHFGKLSDRWHPNKGIDRELLRQFMQEAGLDVRNGISITSEQYDAVLAAASAHGYSVETVGGPDN